MPEEGGEANERECSGKKKRSRLAAEEPKISILGQIKLPDFMKELTDADPEVQELRIKHFIINQRLHTRNVIVASGDGERAPSPEP
jgi:splicing factor 1